MPPDVCIINNASVFLCTCVCTLYISRFATTRYTSVHIVYYNNNIIIHTCTCHIETYQHMYTKINNGTNKLKFVDCSKSKTNTSISLKLFTVKINRCGSGHQSGLVADGHGHEVLVADLNGSIKVGVTCAE